MAERTKHFAPSIRAALASLHAELPDRIDLFNDEAENTVELVMPPADALFFGGSTDYPLPGKIEVAIVHGRATDIAIEQVEWDVEDVRGVVSAWVESPPPFVLSQAYETALAWGRVIAEVLMQPHAWGDGVVVREAEWDYLAFSPEATGRPNFQVLSLSTFTLSDVDARP